LALEQFRRVTARSMVDAGRDTIRRLHSTLDYVFKKTGDWIDA
jgi:hypothetical protein